MRTALFIFVFFLLICFSSAIKISPTQQTLKIKQYGTNCTSIWVLPEKNYSISSMWSFDGRGDLSKYNLTAEKIKIEINYSYLKEGKYKFCFTPKYGGNFSGIIYFYDKESMVEIGSWIDLKVEGERFEEKISLLTGKIIKEYEENKINFLLFICVILLIGVLFITIKYAGPNRKNS